MPKCYGHSETVIEQFIITSYSEKTRDALNFLFIPSSLLQSHPTVPGFLVLPEVMGTLHVDYNLVEELIKSKTMYKVEKIVQFFSNYMKEIVEELVTYVHSNVRKKGKSKPMSEEEMSAVVISIMRAKFKPYLEELFPKIAPQLLPPFLQVFSEGITVALAKYLLEKWEQMKKNIPNYEKMLIILKSINMIQPLVQVIICPYCQLTALIASSSSLDVKACPRCGREPIIGTLYVLNEELAKLKQRHEDIVHFIALYIKHKASAKCILLHPTIEVNYFVKKNVEVDIYIKELSYGIECKIYKVTEGISQEHLENWFKDLKSKIKNYSDSGIRRMLIVTNLKRNTCDILKNKLKTYIDEEKLNIVLEDVLDANVESLINKLDEIVDRVTEEVQKKVKKEMQAKIAMKAKNTKDIQ